VSLTRDHHLTTRSLDSLLVGNTEAPDPALVLRPLHVATLSEITTTHIEMSDGVSEGRRVGTIVRGPSPLAYMDESREVHTRRRTIMVATFPATARQPAVEVGMTMSNRSLSNRASWDS
jgi:hypothetical protein